MVSYSHKRQIREGGLVLVRSILRKVVGAVWYVSQQVYRLVRGNTNVIARLDRQTAEAAVRVDYLTQVLAAKKKLLEARTKAKLLEREISGLDNPLPVVASTESPG